MTPLTLMGLRVTMGDIVQAQAGDGLPASLLGILADHWIAHGQGTPGSLVDTLTSEEDIVYTSAGANRPTYRAGGAGGRGYLEQAIGDSMGTTDTGLVAKVQGTASIVFAGIVRMPATSAEGSMWGVSSAGLGKFNIAARGTDTKVIMRRQGDIGSQFTIAGGGGDFAADTWFAFVCTYDGSGGAAEQFVDGVSEASGNIQNNTMLVDQVALGAVRHPATVNWVGDLSEGILLNAVPTAGQLSDLHSYLAGRL